MSEKKVIVIHVHPPEGVMLAGEEFDRIRLALAEAHLPYEFLILSAELELMDLKALQEFADTLKRRVDELSRKPLEA